MPTTTLNKPMMQQEIFQNMTKGEWPIYKHQWNDSDLEAAASAVNNTYGKGINPEGVENIKDALIKCQQIFNRLAVNGVYPESQHVLNGGEGHAFIEQALTAAKL